MLTTIKVYACFAVKIPENSNRWVCAKCTSPQSTFGHIAYDITCTVILFFMPPLKKRGDILLALLACRLGMLIGTCMSVCKPSDVRSISFDPFF